jgi:hypothetical protein
MYYQDRSSSSELLWCEDASTSRLVVLAMDHVSLGNYMFTIRGTIKYTTRGGLIETALFYGTINNKLF